MKSKQFKDKNTTNTDIKQKTTPTIIIDGIKKTNCPSLGNITKDEPPLQQRVVGVKFHGIKTCVFLCDEFIQKGANLICEILCTILCDLDTSNKLPVDRPVLYLQVDNCGENKNKTLLAFLTDLVRRKILQKLKLVF